jgi:septal ring factor EnvC (AmiA/AmiB activator)
MFGHNRDHLLREVCERLEALRATLHRLERIMSAFTDLQQNVADLLKAASDEIAEVETVVAALSAGTVTDQQLNDLSAQLGSAKDSLNAEAAKIAALVPPAGSPAPVGNTTLGG